MGSRPWKEAQLRRWDSEFSGEIVEIESPGSVYDKDDELVKAEPLQGYFVGTGSWGGRPCVYLHLKPEMGVRDAGYFDHEVAVMLERGMAVALASRETLAPNEENR